MARAIGEGKEKAEKVNEDMKLNLIGEGLWEYNAPMTMIGIDAGHRMQIIQLSDDRLMVISPVQWSKELAGDLLPLGEVAYVVAPSIMHDLFVKDFAGHYPEAVFMAAPGMKEKFPKWNIANDIPLLWPDTAKGELEFLVVEGIPHLNETVFFHRKSRSLIIADLVFNLGYSGSWLSSALLKLFGVYRKVGPSRYFKTFIKDRRAMRQSIDRILQWDFERIIVGHGKNIENKARQTFEKAYEFLI